MLLIAMGIARLGNLIEFIPHPVTTGFTTGIATGGSTWIHLTHGCDKLLPLKR